MSVRNVINHTIDVVIYICNVPLFRYQYNNQLMLLMPQSHHPGKEAQQVMVEKTGGCRDLPWDTVVTPYLCLGVP